MVEVVWSTYSAPKYHTFMTLDHKTSHNGHFFGLRYNYLKIWNLRVKIEKISFKVVQIKFLSMHITNTKLSFDIYGRKCTKYLHGT